MPVVAELPVVAVVPVIADVPVVGQGVVPGVKAGADGVGVETTAGGLTPPAPSSVDPSGIPPRATDDAEPIPVGDEAEAAGPPEELLPIAAQPADAVPTMPPPSNPDVEADVPAVDVPEVVLPMPDAGSELPMPEHCVLPPVVSPSGDAPDAIGLTPEPMPTGEAPGDTPIPPTCAVAEPHPKTAAAIAATNKRVIAGFSPLAFIARRV